MLFAPAPVLVYAVGRPGAIFRSALAVFLAATLTTFAAGWIAGVAFLSTFGFGTIALGAMLERKYPFERIVTVTAAIMMASGICVALLVLGSPDALLNAVRSSLQAGMARGQEVYKSMGIDQAIPADAQVTIIETTVRLSPALLAITSAAIALVNLGVFWRWAGRQRMTSELFGDLTKWSTPEWLIWVLLATGFGLFIPIAPVQTIALNAFICVTAVYFCHGLAIMSFYFTMIAMPPIARGAIYLIACVQPVLAALVCAAGVFDLWIDFRRLKPPSQEAGNFGDFL